MGLRFGKGKEIQCCGVDLRFGEGREFNPAVWSYGLADGLDMLLKVLYLLVKAYIFM